MKLIGKLIILLCLFAPNILQAQNTNQVKKRGPEYGYSRSSMSYLLLDFTNEKYAHYLRNAIMKVSVPSKFDDNNISTKYINAPYIHSSESYVSNKPGKIVSALAADNYASKIMQYWWQLQDDGTYSTNLIKKRGLYNATDEDVSQVDASKVGRARLADAGLKLLGNSYVLVLDYTKLQTMKEIYDRQDAIAREQAKRTNTTFEPVERKQNGFKGKLTSYLFKLNYSDTIQGYLDASFIDENKIDINKFNNIFNNVYTPYKLVKTESVDAKGLQYNPGETLAPARQRSKSELMDELVQSSISNALGNIEKDVAAFRVKTSVTGIDPIKAKIGRKEGIRHERKFVVWEYVENRKEKVVARRKGTVRTRYVSDNRNDELGKTEESEFYQIGGGNIAIGMTLQERKDMGIGIGIGFGLQGIDIQVDVNAGQYLDIPVRQLKLYGEALISGHDYKNVNIVDNSTMENDANYNELKWAIGILKEYPIGRGNIRAGWKIGYTGEITSWTQDKDNPNYDEDRSSENLTSNGVTWGVNFGINLFSSSVHLIASVGGFHYFKTTYNSGIKDAKALELDEKISKIFPDKKSIHLGLSLRYSF